MSDQGFYMGEHGWFDKRWMYEESFRTPILVRYPGVVKPGSVNNNFIMNLDIAPTLLDIAGVAIPKDMQGASFLPLLKNKDAKIHDALYYHYYENGEHSVSPHFGVSNGRYKLIRFYKRVESWELYDLKKDPHEMHNLFGEKKYEPVEVEMYHLLLQLIAKYEDGDATKILNDKLPSEPAGFKE
jgi:arylsulfatase A-like enzyme